MKLKKGVAKLFLISIDYFYKCMTGSVSYRTLKFSIVFTETFKHRHWN